jgi:hypothetical protein
MCVYPDGFEALLDRIDTLIPRESSPSWKFSLHISLREGLGLLAVEIRYLQSYQRYKETVGPVLSVHDPTRRSLTPKPESPESPPLPIILPHLDSD